MFVSSVNAREASGPKGPFGLFGKSYALAITVVIDDEHPLDREMRIINEHYLNWLKRRGRNCHELILGFTAPPNSAEAILARCRRLLMQDAGDEKTLAAMEVDVVIVDAESRADTHYKLKWDGSERSSVVDPKTASPAETTIPGVRHPDSAGQEVLLFQAGDPLADAIEEARRRIPEFKVLLDSRQAGVTVRVPWVCGDIHGIYEANLVGRNGDELEVEFTPDYAPGPVRKTCRMEDILDWTVHHEDGRTTGGFTERAMRSRADKSSTPP